VSAEGAAVCYRTICAEGAALLGRHAHPEVTLHTFALADYMRHIDAGDGAQWANCCSAPLRSFKGPARICSFARTTPSITLSTFARRYLGFNCTSCEVIADGQRRGCDTVALGCTEFPLLISDADSPLPTLGSTRILARAALREALR